MRFDNVNELISKLKFENVELTYNEEEILEKLLLFNFRTLRVLDKTKINTNDYYDELFGNYYKVVKEDNSTIIRERTGNILEGSNYLILKKDDDNYKVPVNKDFLTFIQVLDGYIIINKVNSNLLISSAIYDEKTLEYIKRLGIKEFKDLELKLEEENILPDIKLTLVNLDSATYKITVNRLGMTSTEHFGDSYNNIYASYKKKEMGAIEDYKAKRKTLFKS